VFTSLVCTAFARRQLISGTRGRRCKQLLDKLKGTRGYWGLKEEALGGTMWKTRFGRSYGPVVRLQNELMNEEINETISHCGSMCRGI
jgi:hypothetical protein